jgi:hypothetical protein
MKILVSTCLFGAAPIYTSGALSFPKVLENEIPEARLRVYYDDTAPVDVIKTISAAPNCECVDMTGRCFNDIHRACWRFLAFEDATYDLVMSADIDGGKTHAFTITVLKNYLNHFEKERKPCVFAQIAPWIHGDYIPLIAAGAVIIYKGSYFFRNVEKTILEFLKTYKSSSRKRKHQLGYGSDEIWLGNYLKSTIPSEELMIGQSLCRPQRSSTINNIRKMQIAFRNSKKNLCL